MITIDEITDSLIPLNGKHFTVPNVEDYARKVLSLGKSIELRDENDGSLISYVLYYDNQPDMFISMVWTSSKHQGKSHAKQLLRKLIDSTQKNIYLEVHEDNPALYLYKNLGFDVVRSDSVILKMVLTKTLAVMQPYSFPYIGYFHLINACNELVFYDDVSYIQQGWINRNNILLNGEKHLFTIPVSKASSNKMINEIPSAIDNVWIKKYRKTLSQAYRKAPHFEIIEELVMSVLLSSCKSIADLAIMSIIVVFEYLDLPLNYIRSSQGCPETKGVDKADRLIAMAKKYGYKKYINPIGGEKLYSKDYFSSKGIELRFILSDEIQYQQFSNDFVSGLSIIDVLMFNPPARVKEFFRMYKEV